MARLLSAEPVLCVRQMAPAIDFFVEKLGFALQGTAGEPPSWASVGRDGAQLMLVCGNYPEPAADWAAYVWIDDADGLCAEARGRGAQVVRDPVDKPYNSREFEARMPDGRLIAFGQDTSGAARP